jgi:hypothetical protein
VPTSAACATLRKSTVEQSSLSSAAMVQKYAFTTAAMAAALEDTPVSYEDLAEIEKDFDDAETEISEFSS